MVLRNKAELKQLSGKTKRLSTIKVGRNRGGKKIQDWQEKRYSNVKKQ